METTDSQILKINITGGKQSLSDEYYKHLSMKSDEITSLELYIDSCEYEDKTKKKPLIFFSDLLLTIMQNNPNLKKIKVEGYERYCYTKQYMVHEPSEFGLFYKFTDLVEKYKETGQIYPYFANLEEMNFHKCSLNESDLQVLGSSLFPNLKHVLCFYCTPTNYEIREKYRDFLPFIEWDDKYEFDRHTSIKNADYYSGYYKDDACNGYYLDS